MRKSYIAVLDSGIGGISVLRDLINVMPNENYIYLGDNENVPYGQKNERELLDLTMENLTNLNGYFLKAIVLGCNTLSLLIRDKLEYYVKTKVFGVYPPVESELLKGNNTLLLATSSSAKKFSQSKNLTVMGLTDLAKNIENNAFSLDKISIYDHFPQKAQNKRFDTIILGCTHYEFIKNKIFNHFCPKKIISGNVFTIKTLHNYLKTSKSLEKCYQNEILFFGKNAKLNKKFYFKVVKSCF